MKVSDIKGDFGKRVIYWVDGYINNRIFDEVKMYARPLVFHEHIISLWNMADFKKFLSGVKVGVPTHGCEDGEIPYKSWNIHPVRSAYINDASEVTIDALDIEDPLFTASIDLVPTSVYRTWWELRYCIQCNKEVMMAKLSEMFDNELVKVKNTIHKDIKGQELKVGDVVCYSTTYSNSVHLGTIDKFNDCSMVVDGRDVQYDTVLVVNKEIKYNEQAKRYEHR
jgi:hypothetical protein